MTPWQHTLMELWLLFGLVIVVIKGILRLITNPRALVKDLAKVAGLLLAGGVLTAAMLMIMVSSSGERLDVFADGFLAGVAGTIWCLLMFAPLAGGIELVRTLERRKKDGPQPEKIHL